MNVWGLLTIIVGVLAIAGFFLMSRDHVKQR